MYATAGPSTSDNNESFRRQGSLRRVIPPEPNDNLFGHQNEDLNKVYKTCRQEYVILAEYKMVQSENIRGVYVIPSRKTPLEWFGVIFVRNGPYEDAVFRFTLSLNENFPDCEHPKVIFQSEICHPVIHPKTNELDLSRAFPTWNRNEQHLWQVFKYVQWIFEYFEESLSHGVNEEIVEMYKSNKELFLSKAQELVKLSQEKLYDDPPVDDKHYIVFEGYNPEVHDKVRISMLALEEEKKPEKPGHSWVLPRSYKPLERPLTPTSESES